MATTFHVEIDPTYLRFKPDNPSLVKQMGDDMPAFRAYDEHDEITKQRVFAWIICMYDMNSTLRREIKDLYKRKVYAATLCGMNVSKSTGKYPDWIDKILTGTDEKVNSLIVSFISSFSSPEYTQLMAHVAIQHSILNRIISGKATKENQTVFDIATDKIKALTNLLYGTGERDEVYLARKALYRQVSYDLSDMRPEQVARRIADGDGIPGEWNPYEDGYKVDDINFVSDDPSIAADDEE